MMKPWRAQFIIYSLKSKLYAPDLWAIFISAKTVKTKTTNPLLWLPDVDIFLLPPDCKLYQTTNAVSPVPSNVT